MGIDPTKINVEDWVGMTFTVEIGKIKDSKSNVFDLNGNAIEKNVKFEKTFANIDLNQASTSFTVTLNNINNCSNVTSQICSDEIKDKIKSDLGLNSNDSVRVEVESVSQAPGSPLTAKIKILPTNDVIPSLEASSVPSLDLIVSPSYVPSGVPSLRPSLQPIDSPTSLLSTFLSLEQSLPPSEVPSSPTNLPTPFPNTSLPPTTPAPTPHPSAVSSSIPSLEPRRMLRQSKLWSKSAPNTRHSVGFFRELQKVVEKEQSATDNEFPVTRNTVVSISNMKIIPGHSDMKLIRTDPGMLEEEEDLYHYTSMKGNTGVKQLLISKVERQAMVEEIESNFKAREEAVMKKIERMSDSEDASFCELKAMVGEIENNVEDELKESKTREEAMMNEIERISDVEDELKESKTREEAIFHELKESKAREQAREEVMFRELKESKEAMMTLFRELKEIKEKLL